MKHLTFAVIFLLFFSITLFSQHLKPHNGNDVCGTTEYMNMMIQQEPQYENRLNDLERRIKEYIENNPPETDASVRNIPVVVHIVYKTGQQNIPDTQVVRQIEILNQIFSATNWDISKVPYRFSHLVANPQISFCLAQKDPKNKPTSGITRTYTTKDSFLIRNDVKYTKKGGKDAWPSSKYFNIWVCNNEGWLCYAQFPGGATATDGVVMDYQIFGLSPNNPPAHNYGKVLAHETGHWLNLRHIWGDDNGACTGTDYVDDTPNQSNWINGDHDSSEIIISCDNAPNGAMWMNLMDYTWGASSLMFSLGQSARMDAILATDFYRKKIITSTVCNTQNNSMVNEEIDEYTFKLDGNYPNPFNPSTKISFNLPVSGFTTLKVYDIIGREVNELISSELNAGSHSVTFNGDNLASGIYYYRLESAGNVAVKKMLLIK